MNPELHSHNICCCFFKKCQARISVKIFFPVEPGFRTTCLAGESILSSLYPYPGTALSRDWQKCTEGYSNHIVRDPSFSLRFLWWTLLSMIFTREGESNSSQVLSNWGCKSLTQDLYIGSLKPFSFILVISTLFLHFIDVQLEITAKVFPWTIYLSAHQCQFLTSGLLLVGYLRLGDCFWT